MIRPLRSVGTDNVLFTCKPDTSCLVYKMPFSCLEETTKFGSLFLTPSSAETSTIILPKALVGGTYKPPLSYLAPIQVQLADMEALDEHTMYAFLPESINGVVKFLKRVCSLDLSGSKSLSVSLGIIMCS